MAAAATLKRWLFRLNGPEPAPIRLVQRRVFVLPTRTGVFYGFSLAVMLVGAINYNLSLGYALVFLLGGLGVVAVLHTFRNLVHLRISPGRAEPVFAGQTAHFGMLLANPRAEARPSLRLFFEHTAAVEADVPALGTSAISIPIAATRRGWLHPPPLTLETRFPLGLVRAWSYARPDMRCLVYARPEAAAPPLPLSASGEGQQHHVGRGSEDFSGLRSHQPADPPRHVAWKAVARSGGDGPLLTKVFSGTRSAVQWLDWNDLPPGLDAEARLSRLTRWAIDAAQAGFSFGLRLPSATIEPGGGDRHLRACLEALALHGLDAQQA